MPLSDDQKQKLLDGYAAAEKRLRFAKQDVKEMVANYGNFDAYGSWISFLMSSNSFFSKFEQSTKASFHAKAWYALVKNRRKHNEVMQYLRQARHSDQHSIAQSVHLPRISGPKLKIEVKVLTLEEARDNARHRAELVKLIPAEGQPGYPMLAVLARRQGFWDRWPPELREDLAHLFGLIMRRICGGASAGFRLSSV